MPASSSVIRFYREQIAAYERVRPTYVVFADVLATILHRALDALWIHAIVQSRAKEIPSFAGKMVRKRANYPDPVNQFTDLCGVRIITQTKDDIEPICEFIRRHFEIDEANSEDVLNRLATSEFGYRSVHFIVSLRPGEFEEVLQSQIVRRPEGRPRDDFAREIATLYDRRDAAESERTGLPPGPKFKAEIQVRSLLQHAWAEFAHDRVYKGGFQVPQRLRRQASRIAATLEEADESVARVTGCIDAYRASYGKYMELDDRKQELEKERVVLSFDPTNRPLAQHVARLAMSIEEWDVAVEALRPFVEAWRGSPAGVRAVEIADLLEGEPSPDEIEEAHSELGRLRDRCTAQLLVDYGRALCGTGDTEGRDHLRWALCVDPESVDAHVELATDYDQGGGGERSEDALRHYEAAFKIDPSDPRVLRGLVSSRICEQRNLECVTLLRSSLEKAIAMCREHAGLRIYLPDAHYDIGFFSLLLGQPYEGLSAYALAVTLRETDQPLRREIIRLRRIAHALKDSLPEIGWAARFLTLAQGAAILRRMRSAEHEGRLEQASALREEFEAFRSETLARLASKPLPSVTPPVIIGAGGCDARVEARMQEYRSVMEMAFDGFSCTVFSGGTVAGIGRLLGDLRDSEARPIRRFAYLPHAIPFWTERHPKYTVIPTKGQRFSALEPLQNWIDLMTSGVDPSDVRVIGINGGRISAFEYRMALALGARVGLIRDSGRAASDIVNDQDWVRSAGLLLLPSDPHTVRLFLRGIPSTRALDPEDRERLARQAHEKYLEKRKREPAPGDLALADWEHLSPDLKRSNLQQVDAIEEKLRAIGMTVRKADGDPIRVVEFTDEQIEVMAEVEHARWNVERLESGWTLGPRDPEKKTSPYLVVWSELSEEIKGYDRNAVRNIPAELKELGYEVVPIGG